MSYEIFSPHFNSAAISYSGNWSIVGLFEEQVRKHPDNIAVVFKEAQLTYKELDERSNQLAHYLSNKGVRVETPVAICLERSLEMIIGILGILKAGGAYVPIDPDYPEARIGYVLSDSTVHLLLTNAVHTGLSVFAKEGIDIILLDEHWDVISKEPASAVGADIQPHHLAYVIYTSGSTGVPKGVLNEHKGVVNRLVWGRDYFGLDGSDVVLQKTTFCFDVSVWELLGPLIAGARLVFAITGGQKDVDYLYSVIAEQGVTYIHFVPSMLHSFLEDIAAGSCRTLRMVACSGEALQPRQVMDLREKLPDAALYNLYGPTEAAIEVSYWQAPAAVDAIGTVPIGRPTPGTQLYVVDGGGKKLPAGVPGELWIGGIQVARGYLNRPELTKERFAADPFGSRQGEMLYKTGDLACWLPDGNLAYLGRMDDQVKIHGYRIELGEIEHVLHALGEISSAAVVVKEQAGSGKRLVCYYVPDGDAVKAKERLLYLQQVDTWKEIYEMEYDKAEAVVDLDEEFNIAAIWNDSFTGKAIPDDQMREWLEDIAGVILSEPSSCVLEIGCGTGLIYYQLAGHIRRYTGADFSESSIRQMQRRIDKREREYPPTKLKVCAAHEITLNEGEQPDLVILNSIVQHFPGELYLSDVLARSISMLNGYGRIIIGDVRDNRLLWSFKGRLALDKLDEKTGIQEFVWNVNQELLREEELCLSPEYFYHLQSIHPEITHVHIEWKKGEYSNELILYRYTVTLYIGIEKVGISPEWLDWSASEDVTERLSTSGVVMEKLSAGQTCIGVKDVPNPRLWRERLLAEGLKSREVKHTGDLIAFIAEPDDQSRQVNDLLALARSKGYEVRFLPDADPGMLNLLFTLQPLSGFVKNVYSDMGYVPFAADANIPLFTDICSILQKDIRHALQERLPDHMTPSEFIPLRQLPLTNSGKLDRNFLKGRDDVQLRSKKDYQPPVTALQQQLVEIWQDLLGVKRIGINDSFFELGGHSLLATRAVSLIRKQLKAALVVKDLFDQPTIAALSEYLQEAGSAALLPAIKAGPRPERIPLSFGQERLWFIDNLQGSIQYHIPSVFRLQGPLNEKALGLALCRIVDRHEVLRTIIRQENGLLFQYVSNEEWALEIIEDPVYSSDRAALDAYIQTLAYAPFDLSKDSMIRAQLIRLGEEDHLLMMTLHHIASDGWSSSILIGELMAFYNDCAGGAPADLPELPVQYADYALWQRDCLGGEVLEAQIGYWKKQLTGVGPLQLATDHVRPAEQSNRGAHRFAEIDEELAMQLRGLSQKEGVTLFMTLLTAFNVLLYRYTGQKDICVGSPIAGRTQHELEELVGFFINTLALRTDLSGNPSFSRLLQRVKETTLDAYANQEAPFEKVVEAVMTERDLSRNPIFQVMFVLQNIPEAPTDGFDHLKLTREAFTHHTSQFDLTFFLSEYEGHLSVEVEYCTDLFREETIDRLIDHYQRLLRSAVKDPLRKIAALNLLSSEEERQFLMEFNDTEASYPGDKTIVSVFEERVLQYPDAIAVAFGEDTLSYRELNERSNQLGHYLRGLGVREGTLVPICIDRSLEMLVAILGILKAGGAYVPVDPDYPVERIGYMMEDTEGKVIVSSSHCARVLTMAGKFELAVLLDDHWERVSREAVTAPVLSLHPDHPAYVIYTSGSTGKPKGVVVGHRNVVRLLMTDPALFVFGASDVWTMFHSFCFDFSVWEMYGALFRGGKVVVVPKAVALDPGLFVQLLKKEAVTILNQTPSSFYNVIEAEKEHAIPDLTLRYVIFGGEALQPRKLAGWKSRYPEVSLINMYGITETTVHVTYKEIGMQEIESGHSNIGVPIPTTTCYILDEYRQLLPQGCIGELYVGGAGLATAYLHLPELTQERFVNNPFQTPAEKEANVNNRLYKTGDLARYLPDGNMEYLGRNDHQVKIRGYRIELGEIESKLLEFPGMIKAVVLARDRRRQHLSPEVKEGDSKYLVAYYVAINKLDEDAILEYLNNRLPGYMVPGIFVHLPDLPLTGNGKLDMKALPEPDPGSRDADAVPVNETERRVWEIFAEVLGLDKGVVALTDSFFRLGGDSIIGIRLISMINSELQGHLRVRDLFVLQTVRRIADHLSNSGHQAIGSDYKPFSLINTGKYAGIIGSGKVEDIFPASYLQMGMLYETDDAGTYHDVLVYKIKEAFAHERFIQVWDRLIERQAALRTAFVISDSGYDCVVYKRIDVQVFLYDDADDEKIIEEERLNTFDVSRPGLFRLIINKTATDFQLMLSFHHAILDGWSVASLVNAFAGAYRYKWEIGDDDFPLSYGEFVIKERKALEDKGIEQFWRDYLSGVDVAGVMGKSHGESGIVTTGFTLRGAGSEKVSEIAKALSVSVDSIFLYVYVNTLAKFLQQDDVVIGLVVNNRMEKEGGDTVLGLFLNTIPYRYRVRVDRNDYKKEIVNVFEHKASLYDYKEYPYGRIKMLYGHELFQYAFNFTHFHVLRDNKGYIEDMPGFEKTNLPFLLDVSQQDGEGFSISCITDSEFVDRQYADYFVSYYQFYLNALCEGDIDLTRLTGDDVHKMTVSWNDTVVPYPKDKMLATLFEEQAFKTPDNIAVAFEGQELTYRQLNEVANKLGNYLRSNYRVGPDDLVGVMLDRSEWVVIALLGVLKSGAAYVPVDPGYPAARVGYIQTDSRWKVLIDADELMRFRAGEGAYAGENCTLVNRPHDLTCVIYTSGSTGEPKGCMLENKGVVNQLFSKIDLLKLDTDAVICHNSQLHFVGGIWQLWAPLLRGGKVILCNEEELRSVGRLLHKAAVSGATMLEIIPSQLNEHLFSEKRIDLTGLSTLILTGEKLNTHFVGKCYAGNPHVEIINTYGQTECSDVTTFYKIPRVSDSGSVLIGRPIQNTEIYILSADGILCPVGVVGEICTGGDGVSRGYLNKSKLTAEKFVDNPFKKGERMYKTGDLGRWLFDGTIEIIGRKDDQVKIRGYRIEIEEIQQALLQYEVEEAVLLFSDDTKKLVAYIVSKDRLNVNDIRTFLSKRIPGYMIPAQYVQVEQIPLLPNGKIDKKALLRMESNSMDTGIEYVEPRNEVEIRIREIWSAVLQKGKIGIHDDFFALGGHSLLLIQLVNKMNAAFEKAGIRLVDLIKSTTIEQLGTVIRTRQDGLEPLASSSHRDNPYIIKLREGEDGTPTFIIPGMPGVSDGYIDLARGIRTPGVVYGLQMRGLLGEDPLNSIEKMAVHNISLIRAVGPVQSINLYAHSYGGTVVYEMLRQLNGTGITVKELVLIECFPMRDERHSAGESRRGPGESRRGPGELRRVPDVEDSGISDVGSRVTDEEMLYSFVYSVLLKDAQVMPDEALREILRRPKQEWTKRLYDLLKKGGLEINELVFMRLWTLYEQSLSVHYTYPGQLARRVTLVLADDQANQQTYADWMRWADYFQHVDVLHSPGDHFSIVKEPYCGEWLARLSY